MARIEGVDLPRNKRVEVALNYIYGIGPSRSREIIAATRVNPDTRVKDLTETDVSALREFIGKNYKVEGDLRREVQMNIKRLIEIGCDIAATFPFVGSEPAPTLAPVRGQRRPLPVAAAVVVARNNLCGFPDPGGGPSHPAAAWVPVIPRVYLLMGRFM